MKRNGRVFDVLAAVGVAVLLMGFVACDNGSGNSEPDTWTAVTSPQELVGTWEGSETTTLDIDGGVSISATVIIRLEVTSTTMTTTMTIDMKDAVNEMVASDKATDAATAWNQIKISFNSKVIVDDTNYTATQTESVPVSSLTGDSGAEINQYKTKIRMPSLFSSDSNAIIILTKK